MNDFELRAVKGDENERERGTPKKPQNFIRR